MMESEATRGDILIVDDMPHNLELLSAMLIKRGYVVRPALNGAMALRAAKATPPDLILLDINMPELNGYEVCRRLKNDQETRDIPVIFISALDETIDKVRAFEVGGVDYVTKPFQVEEVLARIETQLMLYRQRLELERQRRELEILRERERQYFNEMNRVKDEFVRTVSHDLKNPISVVVGYVHLLREGGNIADPDDLLYLDRIEEGAESMRALIMNLLDLARLEAGSALTLEPHALSEFLRICLEGFELAAENKGIELVYTPPPNDMVVAFDRTRMIQAISNLLSNAIKYTPSGGRVELCAEVSKHEVSISVCDNGIGISEDDMPNLFKKFYRVHNARSLGTEGTGLGLSIVKAVIEQHQGAIEVESEVGVGSTFHIRLPVVVLVAD